MATQNELARKFKESRRANTPLVSIATPDQLATIRLVAGSVNGKAAETPIVCWDIGQGFWHMNEAGLKQISAKCGGNAKVLDPAKAMATAASFESRTIVFVINAHRFLDNVVVMQLVFNLRDTYKIDKRTLVLLGPEIKLPAELANDVVELDEPYPDDPELRRIVRRCYDNWEGLQWKLTTAIEERAALSLKGCAAFGAEQHWTMAARVDGVSWDDLNASVRKTVEQTPGIRYEDGRETFADLGGLSFAKKLGEKLFAGPRRPSLVVRIEEIEKAMVGSDGGDLSGTSTDALQVLLSSFEDYGWSGMIAYGAPGAGKSAFSKALANTHGARGLVFDVNACKDKYVGTSEQRIRQAVKVMRSIGGDRVFFVASCNDAEMINDAFKARFRAGIWYFDVPSDEDQQRIWQIHRAKWHIPESDEAPVERDLIGRDIASICEMAFTLGLTLAEARDFVVPLKVQNPKAIENARGQANGRFLDASRGGTYRQDAVDRKETGNRRKVKMNEE